MSDKSVLEKIQLHLGHHIKELQAENERLNNRLSRKESKVCDLSSDNIHLEMLLAEKELEIARLKEQYESTPERDLFEQAARLKGCDSFERETIDSSYSDDFLEEAWEFHQCYLAVKQQRT